jgi:undecaprenyl phosphate N,N'-diacetylbacillosamine 1-phosphate transferase
MYKKHLKRLLGLVLSILGLPIFAVIFFIVAPLIVIEDKGPVFYNASRLGRNGRIYKMYKFRSMKVNAPDLRNEDGTTFNSENDPRVTKIGRLLRKTSLDETPQLFNVIKGDMALIGPRPDLTDGEMTSDRKKKLTVRPGITGYSQAYYRNSDSVKQRMINDLYYVDHVSFGLDMKILMRTIQTVFQHQNVYRNEGGSK